MFISNTSSSIPASVKLLGCDLKAQSTLEILGVTLDDKLHLSKHVNKIVSGCYYQLCKINSIRKFISEDLTKLLVIHFILSRLDYCNSILYGIPNYLLNRLQIVQNRAARLVFLCDRFTPASPLLRKLHWLPINKRIIYKVSVFMFKTFYCLPVPLSLGVVFERLSNNSFQNQSRFAVLYQKDSK